MDGAKIEVECFLFAAATGNSLLPCPGHYPATRMCSPFYTHPNPPFNLATLGPALAVLGGLLVAFWPLMKRLPEMWFGDETYYAHGVVVPICAGLIIWDRWDKLKAECKPGPWWALIPLLGLSWITWGAAGNSTRILLSLLLIAMCLNASFVVLGWAGLRRLATPSL